MNEIKNLILDEERALYNLKDTKIINIKFDGVADGESALKECNNIDINDCYFNLRYPLWHVDKFKLYNSEMTEKCRAAIWYSKNMVISNCKLNGIKALRECENIEINDTHIESFEFGWKSNNINLNKVNLIGEYLFFDSSNIKINEFKLKGKYSFQYVKNLEIENSYLDTKDAFWHTENVVVKNSTIKGEYLGWYSKNLTLINCKIIGTQPLCYCENLVLENCTTEQCDLSFEYSNVNGNVLGCIDSIKNPLSGIVEVEEVKELIFDDKKYNCQGKVIIKNRKKSQRKKL